MGTLAFMGRKCANDRRASSVKESYTDEITTLLRQVDSMKLTQDSLLKENELLRTQAKEIPQTLIKTQIKYVTKYTADLNLIKTVKRVREDSAMLADQVREMQDKILMSDREQDSLISELYARWTNCIDSSAAYPVIAEFKDDWADIQSAVTADSASFSVRMREALEFRHERKNRLFSGPEWTTVVSSLNPYVTNADAVSYVVKDNKRFGIGLTVGYGGTIYNGVVKASPFAGLGLTLNLVRF